MACQVMVGYAYYAIECISPYAMLGSVHVLEGMSVLLADQAADAIKRSLGRSRQGRASPTCARTARSTRSTSPSSRRSSNGIADPTPSRSSSTISKIFYRLYGDIFRDLGAATARQEPCRLRASASLITGAGSGIGRALAIEASRRGMTVALVRPPAEALPRRCRMMAPAAAICRCAATSPIRPSGGGLRDYLGSAGGAGSTCSSTMPGSSRSARSPHATDATRADDGDQRHRADRA